MKRHKLAPQLESLYAEIGGAGRGPEAIELIGRAIQIAEELNDEEALYQLRCCLVEAAANADDAETELASFSWALERHRSDPARFPVDIYRPLYTDISWTFKWVLDMLQKNSAIGRGQLMATLDAMDDLYRRNGIGPSAPSMYRLSIATALGDVDALPELLERAEATPRDTHSDCEACVPHMLASAELALGRTDRAIERGRASLKGGQTCLSEPQELLGELIVPLLLAGDVDTAVDYLHRNMDKTWLRRSERLQSAGHVLTAAAVTENVAFGLDLLERRLPDLAGVLHHHRVRMEFLAGAALVLDRAVRDGLGARVVRDTTGVLAAQGIADGSTAAELAPRLWAEAERYAAAFDEGSGTGAKKRWLERMRALADVSIPADLGYGPAEPLVARVQDEPTTGPGWIAWAYDRTGDFDAAARAAEAALRLGGLSDVELLEALSWRVSSTARLAQRAAEVDTVDAIPAEAQAELSAAVDAFRAELARQGKKDEILVMDALGVSRYSEAWDPQPEELSDLLEQLRGQVDDPAELGGIEFDLSISLLRHGRGDEALPYAFVGRDHLLARHPRPRSTRIHLAAGEMLMGLEHPDAEAEVRAAIESAGSSQGSRARALSLLGRLYGTLGRFDEGAVVAAESAQLLQGLGLVGEATGSRHLCAALLDDAGDLAGAIAETRRVLDAMETLEGANTLPVRLDLGRRLFRSGQAEQAVAVLRDLDRDLLTAGTFPDVAYECAVWLGAALLDVDDANGAVQVYENAIRTAEERGDAMPRIEIARQLGNVFADYSMWDEAIATFEGALAVAVELEDEFAVARLRERIGIVRGLSGDPGGLDDIDAAIDVVRALGASLIVADWTDSRARVLNRLGRVDEAVAAELTAADMFLDGGDRGGWGNCLDLTARMLADAGRQSDAVGLLSPLVEEPGDDPILLALQQLLSELQ
ncbi:MAG: hypothetical protein QM713_08635 [Arachnia sp.]